MWSIGQNRGVATTTWTPRRRAPGSCRPMGFLTAVDRRTCTTRSRARSGLDGLGGPGPTAPSSGRGNQVRSARCGGRPVGCARGWAGAKRPRSCRFGRCRLAEQVAALQPDRGDGSRAWIGVGSSSQPGQRGEETRPGGAGPGRRNPGAGVGWCETLLLGRSVVLLRSSATAGCSFGRRRREGQAPPGGGRERARTSGLARSVSTDGVWVDRTRPPAGATIPPPPPHSWSMRVAG